jgi:hypothetical protein
MRSLALLLFLLTTAAFGDTTWVAPGAVFGHWSAPGSPYILQGPVYIPADSTLEMGPGVRVHFTGHDSLVVRSGARLRATGQPADSVVFTTDTLANPLRWGGVITHDADTCRLDYCVFEFGSSIGEPRSSLCFHNTALQITNSSFRGMRGGTLLFWGGSIELSGSRFHNNYNAGGNPDGCALDIYPPHCTGHVTDCVFENNVSVNDGGAVDIGNWDTADTVFVTHCDFRANTADGGGGGLQNEGGVVVVSDCRFEGNSAAYGGALRSHIWPLIVRGCTVTGNLAARGGGAENGSGQLTVSDSYFAGNRATESGGGVSHLLPGSTLERCVFDLNTAPIGGAIAAGDGTDRCTIRNCTIVRNTALTHGSAIYNPGGSQPVLVNSIVAFNRPPDAYAFPPAGSVTLHHNDFFGNGGPSLYGRDSSTYPANLYLDPLFVDTAAGNFRLRAASPCIDAGDPSTALDPDSTTADLGAYYFDQTPQTAHRPLRPYPLSLSLSASPNPFNPVTTISFDLPMSGFASVKVFDLTGRQAAELWNGRVEAGAQAITWNARQFPSGTYFAVLSAAGHTHVSKLLLLK